MMKNELIPLILYSVALGLFAVLFVIERWENMTGKPGQSFYTEKLSQ